MTFHLGRPLSTLQLNGCRTSIYMRAFSTATTAMTPTKMYESHVESGAIRADPIQTAALRHLQKLYDELKTYSPLSQTSGASAARKQEPAPKGSGLFSSMFGSSKPARPAPVAVKDVARSAPKGVYIHGGVGCGKTFLMDLFFDVAPSKKKKRVHFHSFMLDVHERMHRARQLPQVTDPIQHVTDGLLAEAHLLCFDEFQVTDVADALILRRLFSAMMGRGMVVVATSNRPPSELYKNGLQREAFVPFIAELQRRCVVVSMEASSTDYRLEKKMEALGGTFLTPLNSATTEAFNVQFEAATRGMRVGPHQLYTQGRSVSVPVQAELPSSPSVEVEGVAADSEAVTGGPPRWRRVARFSFSQLCESARGAADYIAICRHYDAVFVHDIPLLSLAQINHLRRFIILVDTLYEEGVQLVATAAAPPPSLFQAVRLGDVPLSDDVRLVGELPANDEQQLLMVVEERIAEMEVLTSVEGSQYKQKLEPVGVHDHSSVTTPVVNGGGGRSGSDATTTTATVVGRGGGVEELADSQKSSRVEEKRRRRGSNAAQELHDEAFAFDRTVSRLMEMQSEEYRHRLPRHREQQ